MRRKSSCPLVLEELEPRVVLNNTVVLKVGALASTTYVDGNGDRVTVSIAGSKGQATLNTTPIGTVQTTTPTETTTDRSGQTTSGTSNLATDRPTTGSKTPTDPTGQPPSPTTPDRTDVHDSGLDDHVDLSAIEISGATPDFRLEFRREGTSGDGVIQLGKVTATGQVIQSIGAAGTTTLPRLKLASFSGAGFASGGGLRVNDITGDDTGLGLALSKLDAGTTLTIDGDLAGAVHIAGDLAGTVKVGGLWTGELNVGGDLAAGGQVKVSRDSTGEATIAGNLDGLVDVNGNVSGKWTIIGCMNAAGTVHAGTNISQLWVIDRLFGTVTAGGQLACKVSGSIGENAHLRAAAMNLKVGDSFFGLADATTTLTLDVADSIGQSAHLVTPGTLTANVGREIIRFATLQAGVLVTHHMPEVTEGGTVISKPGYVITKPGEYRLADHLVYTSPQGAAIGIRCSDVVLDLQGYAVVGTAGPGSAAIGILVSSFESNVVVRNGTIRGFSFGLVADGTGSGDRVENIRAVNNWYFGLWVSSANCVLQNNLVLDTGGSTAGPEFTIPIGLRAFGSGARVLDNIVAGVSPTGPSTQEVVGIHVDRAPGGLLSGNRVVTRSKGAESWGLWVNNGAWTGAGRTNLLVQGDLYVGLDLAISLTTAAVVFQDTVTLHVGSPFITSATLTVPTGVLVVN